MPADGLCGCVVGSICKSGCDQGSLIAFVSLSGYNRRRVSGLCSPSITP